MKRFAGWVLIVLTAVGTASAGYLAMAAPASQRSTIVGRVVSVSEFRVVLDTEVGEQIVLAKKPEMRIPADLTPDTKVCAEVQRTEYGEYAVRSIVTLQPATTPLASEIAATVGQEF